MGNSLILCENLKSLIKSTPNKKIQHTTVQELLYRDQTRQEKEVEKWQTDIKIMFIISLL
jgi:pyrimidine operon attenuation protein/uracil phosphoribosyltransferase